MHGSNYNSPSCGRKHCLVQYQRDPFTFTQVIIWTSIQWLLLAPNSQLDQLTILRIQPSISSMVPCSTDLQVIVLYNGIAYFRSFLAPTIQKIITTPKKKSYTAFIL